jgi:peroxiredoxin Q/BCP
MKKLAPDFNLKDQNSVSHKLADYKGDWLVLFFYPKDRSLNCTKEVCTFRDEYSIIGQFGNAKIVGINRGTIASHKKFGEKNNISFPLLSDENGVTTKAYGAWRSNKPALYDLPFATRRNTYLINPQGEIVKEYLKVNPRNHAFEVIQDLQILSKQ